MYQLNLKGHRINNVLLTTFIAITIIAAISSELFQSKTGDHSKLKQYANPLSTLELNQLQSFGITNKLGEFSLSFENNSWTLSNPRKLPGNTRYLKELIEKLKAISIDKVYTDTDFNMTNYSLKEPLASIHFEDKQGEKHSIDFGLINAIDQSSYLFLSKTSLIYKVKNAIFNLASVDFKDLIDSFLVPVDMQNIKSVSLIRPRSDGEFLKITKENDNWISQKSKVLIKEKSERLISKVFYSIPYMIVDQMGEETKERIENYMKNPIYKMKLKELSGKEHNIKITGRLRKMKELRLSDGKYIAVQVSDRPNYYIFPESYLNNFRTNEYRLRSTTSKSIFY